MLQTLLFLSAALAAPETGWQMVDDFRRADTPYHGIHWESLNPGYWKLEDNALRRRLKNLGNANPSTSYPWHWSTGGKTVAPRTGDRTPNLPMGMVWSRDWQLTGNYALRASFTVKDLEPEGRGEKGGFFGLTFGGESLYESRQFSNRGAGSGSASWMALWHKDGTFGLYDHGAGNRPLSSATQVDAPALEAGDTAEIAVTVSGPLDGPATLTATLIANGVEKSVSIENVARSSFTDGYLGLACYGALDFEVNRVEIAPEKNEVKPLRLNELHVCYPLGDTLRLEDGQWKAKFVALFRSGGQRVSIRVADSANPSSG